MKKYLLIVLAVLFVCGAMAAYAVTTDTPSTTQIDAVGTDNTLDYQNSGGSAQTQVNTSTISTVVTAMYGFGGLNAPANQTTDPATAVSYLYVVTNEGNASDTYNLTKSTSYSGGASGWTIAIRNSGDTTDITDLTVAEDATGTFKIKVTPLASSAPNASYADVTATVSSAATPVGAYTGANGNAYGGVRDASDTARTTILASVMTLTRTATVDAPTAYISNTSAANKHDPVPGAVITYKIIYAETAGGVAQNAVIIDKVPTNTTGLHTGAVTSEISNVTITQLGENPNGAAWTVLYTTGAVGGSYTSLGTGKQTIPTTATFVKFTKATVAASETGQITWGVTIK